MRGTIPLADVVEVVDVVQEADMVGVMEVAVWQPHPLKIPGSSQPWVVNEVLLFTPIAAFQSIRGGLISSLKK